jgi:signal transduction histidine kinase
LSIGAGSFITDISDWFCDLPFEKLVWDDRVKEHFWLAADADVDIDLFYRCIHPEDRELTRKAIEGSIANHSGYDVEYRTVSPEGKQKWIRATGRTAYDVDGKPIRFDGVTQDVTALKQTREALIRSEKLALVGRLAASISHEINNPLEAVINLLYLISQNSNDELVKSFSESAQQELARVFTTKGEKGTGLGLWVSREILRKHHATMRVRSRQEAQRSGTTFSMWLPVS